MFNKQRAALAVSAGLILGALAAPMAHAQEKPAPWIRMTATSGCVFFLYDYEDPTGHWYKETPWTWTGGCTGGIASGSGDLTTIRSSSSGRSFSTGYRGAMVGGYMNGRIEEISDGKMLADYYWQNFEMGCGTAGHFVYCEPASLTASPAAPPRATASAPLPASSPRVGNDASAIMAALGVESEDRVFAMLAELAQTGKIDLAREAQLQLSRRFPDSPLLVVASQLISAMMQPSSSTSAPPAATALRGATLNNQTLKQIAEATYGPSTDVSTAGPPAYEVLVPKDGLKIPVVVEISENGGYVWFSARLTDNAVSPQTAALALQRVKSLQPTMMWEDLGLRLGLSLRNRDLTSDEITRAIDQVASDVVATQDVWGS